LKGPLTSRIIVDDWLQIDGHWVPKLERQKTFNENWVFSLKHLNWKLAKTPEMRTTSNLIPWGMKVRGDQAMYFWGKDGTYEKSFAIDDYNGIRAYEDSQLNKAHPGFRGGHAKSRSISELSSAFPRFRVL